MQVYFALGSNEGDRQNNLSHAIVLLQDKGLQIKRLSPVVESPALLPENAPADWNLPFLNLVLEAEVVDSQSPQQWRRWCKEIQQTIGRDKKLSSWAPRPIDIDILLWGDEIVADDDLQIPDPDLVKRAFVLSPLLHLRPDLTPPGQINQANKTLFQYSYELEHHIPLWMGIINVTPDSFSDGGQFTAWDTVQSQLEAMLSAGANIIDIGAESTRPGAKPLTANEEWQRLIPILEQLGDAHFDKLLRPLFSIDTYHVETAIKALDWGADIINDVSGLTNPEMLALARDSDCDWIAMHHVTVPADSRFTLTPQQDPYNEIEQWLIHQLDKWSQAGLDLNRIIFDPGIGFGKDGLQSLMVLRQAARFRQHGLRVLIGHSRKSFMKNFSKLETVDKDMVTVGASLALCEQGVDIIRVHNVPAHIAAYRGWSHLQDYHVQKK